MVVRARQCRSQGFCWEIRPNFVIFSSDLLAFLYSQLMNEFYIRNSRIYASVVNVPWNGIACYCQVGEIQTANAIPRQFRYPKILNVAFKRVKAYFVRNSWKFQTSEFVVQSIKTPELCLCISLSCLVNGNVVVTRRQLDIATALLDAATFDRVCSVQRATSSLLHTATVMECIASAG